MGGGAILAYLLGAAGYAVAAAVPTLAGWAAWTRRRPGMAVVGLALSTFFVVFLALHPFPPRGDVACIAPILNPLVALDPYLRFWAAGWPLSVWATSLGIITPVVNVVFFVAPGMFLARLTRRWGMAAAFGIALTGFIETAQVTGLFGFYACPYRTFDTADMILNIAGVLAGFALVRWWIRAR